MINLEIYSGEQVNITYDKVDPTCKQEKSGTASVRVSGDAGPYFIVYIDKKFASGELISGLGPGSYSWPVINNAGCTRDTVRITLTLIEEPECDRFFMPNAFTPNGDGRNDDFSWKGDCKPEEFHLEIHNRYGQVVFSTSNPYASWDGKGINGLATEDIYVYHLEYKLPYRKKQYVNNTIQVFR